VNVELDLAKTKAQMRVTFDKQGKIAGLYFLDAGAPVPD